jgi:hypothetical protein
MGEGREEGFYWINQYGEWEPARYADGVFWMIGSGISRKEVDEVGYRITPPEGE